MKPRGLDLPDAIAPILARASQWPGPPTETRDRLRGRLDWAFIVGADTKVVYAPGRNPLHAVTVHEGRAQRSPLRPDRWALRLARAAAVVVLGHVPLALAGLGAAVAVVPVTQLLISRVRKDRPPPHATAQGEPGVAHRPVPSPLAPPSASPSLLVVPPLAPLPPSFEASPVPFPSAAQPIAPRVAPPPPAAFRAVSEDAALSVERELLDRARLALVRGDTTSALAGLSEHGARYPDSQLAEDREALTIQALLRAGRVGDARFRDQAFRRRFPSSLLLPALDAALHE